MHQCFTFLRLLLLLTLISVGEAGAQNARDAECHSNCGARAPSSSQSKPQEKSSSPGSGGIAPDAIINLSNKIQELEKQEYDEQARRERASIKQQLDQLRKTDAGQQCPQFVEVNSQRHSVIDVIQQYGQASKALVEAKSVLRQLQAQGDCASSADARNCNSLFKLWRGLVDALDCHAHAGDDTLTAGQIASATTVSESSNKNLISMLDTPSAPEGTGKGNNSKPAGGDKKSGSKASSGASGSRAQSRATESAFPTPRCQFVSDTSLRHDTQRYVCVSGEVYECRDRSNSDPRQAWSRVVAAGGCGSLRTIEEVERELHDLNQLNKSLSENE